MSNTGPIHWQAIEPIFRYIKGIIDLYIQYIHMDVLNFFLAIVMLIGEVILKPEDLPLAIVFYCLRVLFHGQVENKNLLLYQV